jgi:hypothetical protein
MAIVTATRWPEFANPMSAKDIVLKPISARLANDLVRRVHYSGKVVNNSQLHIGVYYRGHLEGAMQFGPSLDKRKIMGLVEGTGWNEFIELNRMAFTDVLPRNSESRALAIAIRMLRRHAPHVKWIVTFADGTQCGDGTIYRAAGFLLTQIRRNDQIWEFPDGQVATRMVATDTRRPQRGRLLESANRISKVTATKGTHILESGSASMRPFIDAGARPLPGFQLRYIYFVDPAWRERLTVPVLPYSDIARHNAGMYRGEPRARGVDSGIPADHAGGDGANPILALHKESSED